MVEGTHPRCRDRLSDVVNLDCWHPDHRKLRKGRAGKPGEEEKSGRDHLCHKGNVSIIREVESGPLTILNIPTICIPKVHLQCFNLSLPSQMYFSHLTKKPRSCVKHQVERGRMVEPEGSERRCREPRVSVFPAFIKTSPQVINASPRITAQATAARRGFNDAANKQSSTVRSDEKARHAQGMRAHQGPDL